MISGILKPFVFVQLVVLKNKKNFSEIYSFPALTISKFRLITKKSLTEKSKLLKVSTESSLFVHFWADVGQQIHNPFHYDGSGFATFFRCLLPHECQYREIFETAENWIFRNNNYSSGAIRSRTGLYYQQCMDTDEIDSSINFFFYFLNSTVSFHYKN